MDEVPQENELSPTPEMIREMKKIVRVPQLSNADKAKKAMSEFVPKIPTQFISQFYPSWIKDFTALFETGFRYKHMGISELQNYYKSQIPYLIFGFIPPQAIPEIAKMMTYLTRNQFDDGEKDDAIVPQ